MNFFVFIICVIRNMVNIHYDTDNKYKKNHDYGKYSSIRSEFRKTLADQLNFIKTALAFW